MDPEAEEWVVNDDPENVCFGCSPHNTRGLRLRFQRRNGGMEALYTAPGFLAGAPGVIHGGVQATLLDEVMGMAVHGERRDTTLQIVTADFQLRYRRPAPVDQPLVVRGRLVRQEGADYHVVGEIVDAAGEVLTRAEARWRRISGGE